MPIHQRLKQLRLEKNLSQQELADRLHISQNSYSLMENGVTKIDEQRIYQLAEVLNVHPFDLFTESDVTLNFYDKVENGYSAYIQTLNADSKELIAQLTEQLTKKDEQIQQLIDLLRKSLGEQ